MTADLDNQLNQVLSERRIERIRRVINSWPRWKRDFKLVRGPEQIKTTSMKERIAKLRKDPKKSKALDRAAEKIFKELEMIEREGVVDKGKTSGKFPSKEEIREVFLANGFSIKPGDDDLKQYVYDAARGLLSRYGGIATQHYETTKDDYKGAAETCRAMGAGTFAKCFEKAAQTVDPVKEPSKEEMAEIWEEAHKPFGDAPFLMSHVEYSRDLLNRYGHPVTPEGWQLIPSEPTEMPNGFGEWFAKNYPGPETIIHDPSWHAPRIWRAAICHTLKAAPKFGEEE